MVKLVIRNQGDIHNESEGNYRIRTDNTHQ